MDGTSPDTGRRRPGRPPRSEAVDTRTLLLDVAVDLFAEHGFAGTSVRKIARAAGLSEGGLYAHFASKQAIYQEVFAESGPHVVVHAVEALLTRPDLADRPAESLRALVRNVLDAWDQPRARKMLSLVLREGGQAGPQVQGGIEAATARLGEVFADWVDRGLMRHSVVSPQQLAWELLAPVAHARTTCLHAQAGPAQRRHGRDLATAHVEFFIAATVAAEPVPDAAPRVHEPQKRRRGT